MPRRALHSAGFSLLGAVGFIASATLPADHFAVCHARLLESLSRLTLLSSLAMAASLSQLAVHLPAFPHCWAGSPQICILLLQLVWLLRSTFPWERRARSSVCGSTKQTRRRRDIPLDTGPMQACSSLCRLLVSACTAIMCGATGTVEQGMVSSSSTKKRNRHTFLITRYNCNRIAISCNCQARFLNTLKYQILDANSERTCSFVCEQRPCSDAFCRCAEIGPTSPQHQRADKKPGWRARFSS